MNCPKCEADIGDSYEPDDPSVGICGGWYCDACDLAIGEHEAPREPMEGDVEIMTAREFRGERPLGTPLSELSGQPGDPNNPKTQPMRCARWSTSTRNEPHRLGRECPSPALDPHGG